MPKMPTSSGMMNGGKHMMTDAQMTKMMKSKASGARKK